MNIFPIRLSVAVLVFALPLIAACEDPSNVGLDLVGGQAGTPTDTSASVVDMEGEPLERPVDVPPRVLAGTVDDPLLGRIAAEGYIDFVSAAGSDFRAGTVERAELRLVPDYVYGDTTVDVTIALRSVLEEWEEEDLPVDTTFNTGSIIREFTFRPTDTLVVVPMPDVWVGEHEDSLRSETFSIGFHGFRLDHVSGNAVVGFGGGSMIAAYTEDDSASFPVSKAYAGLERATPADVPAARALVQAGIGPIVKFRLEIDEDDLADHAINRAALTFWADTLSLEQELPTGFVRPQLTTLDLIGNISGGGLVLLDRSNIDDQGRFVFRSDGSPFLGLARALQQTLLGTRTYESFELRIPPAAPGTTSPDQTELRSLPASINAMLLYDTSSEEHAPVSYLTLTPIDS